eukprot:XP_012808997.1 PREDICTED: ubiquitin thioesterase OTUB1 isoform X2 [Xenopus tropicalis]
MAAEESERQQQSDCDGVNCLTYDEAIIAQQDRIQQEIAGHTPLLSERLDLSVLYQEYAPDDQVYQEKIKDLHRRYNHIRRTRPDGNCFYRAFGFAYLEALLGGGPELARFKEVSLQSKDELIRQGFTEFTIEDFHNTEVEPMCKESDHIHIISLSQALNVSIQVEYMDRGEGGTTVTHVFPEGSDPPQVFLLYRPGHYDILYK